MKKSRLQQIIKEEIQKVLEGFIRYEDIKPYMKTLPISGAANTIKLEIHNIEDFMAKHNIKDQSELERELVGTLKMKYGTGTTVILNNDIIHVEDNPLDPYFSF
jgi:hypothetical protein